ncbi:hypothetical protein [Brevundimonas sp.]|uniref:hypothetical protein n=1 Tax=Brevundimonas sp. TaxID=1871086 RepID=UPI0025BF72F4|nr:hypothetical protein [Brevundimonas sp.]MCG2662436.1 hypothetical protein [Brevundimonas sp.]
MTDLRHHKGYGDEQGGVDDGVRNPLSRQDQHVGDDGQDDRREGRRALGHQGGRHHRRQHGQIVDVADSLDSQAESRSNQYAPGGKQKAAPIRPGKSNHKPGQSRSSRSRRSCLHHAIFRICETIVVTSLPLF